MNTNKEKHKMKTNKITKWAALLATLGGLAALSQNVNAQQSLYVNGTAHPAETGVVYSATSTARAALQVQGTSAAGLNGSYTGADITISSTFDAGVGRHGAYVYNQGALSLTNGVITVMGYGIYAAGASTVTVNGGAITTGTGINSYGVRVVDSSLALNGVNISTVGLNGRGVSFEGGASGTLTDTTITTAGDIGIGVYMTGVGDTAVTLNQVRITTTGADMAAYGIRMTGEGDKSLEIFNSSVTVKGPLTAAIFLSPTSGVDNQAQAVIDHSAITSDHGHTLSIGNDTDRVKNWAAMPDFANTRGIYNVTVRNGTVLESEDGHDAIHINSFFTGTLSGGDGAILSGTINLLVNLRVDDTEINDSISVLCSATANIDFSNGAALNSNLTVTDRAVANVNLADSGITGNLITTGSAALTVALDNSVFTGVTTLGGNSAINLTLTNANWNLTGRSKVTTLNSSGGGITIANVEGDDLTVSGGITGQTALRLTLSDGVKDQTEIRVIVDETNAMSNSAFVLGSEVSNGMYDYVLENKTDGAWLIYTENGGPTPPIISSEGDAVLNTAAAVSGFWFTQLDSLHKRMGELRYGTRTSRPQDDSAWLNNIWVRAYGQQINANTGIPGVKGFSETQYGVDLGADKAWSLDKNNTLHTGVFAGYGGAERDFHTSYNGSTDSGYGGLYAT
jgi:hypothetical protein